MTDEFVLFEVPSKAWACDMPVTFIDHGDNVWDIHCQTGDHHVKAIKYAAKMLDNMDMTLIDSGEMYMTGIYYQVKLKEEIIASQNPALLNCVVDSKWPRK